MNVRNRTPSRYVYYGLHLYFSGLSLRKASERLSQLYKRNHVAIWNWIQKYRPQKLKATRRRIQEYVVDETMLKVGSEYIWLWVAIEPENRQILALFLPKVSKERNMFVAERYLSGLVKVYGKHPVSTEMEVLGTQMACLFLKLDHHIHSSLEKSLIEIERYSISRTEPNALTTTSLAS
jgi:putative transposase